MNMRSNWKQHYIFFFLLTFFSIFLLSTNSLSVFSGDLEEYEQKLEEKRKEKEAAESYLEYIKGEINRIQNSGYSLDHQIRLMDEELKKVDKEMERVLDEIEGKIEYIAEKEKELDEKQKQVNSISDRLYKNSRVSFIDILFSTANDYNMIHSLILNRFVISSQVAYMRGIANDMIALNIEREELEKEKEKFEEDQAEMEKSKILLAQQRAQIQAVLGKQIAERQAVVKRIEGIETQIGHLLEEQKEAAKREASLIGGAVPPQPTTPPKLDSGGFYITGRGRDLMQGHGVGMSQWGAYGGAEKGMSAEEILKFYFTNVRIEARPGKVTVDGKTMDQNVYVAGLGEVPSKACGTAKQASDRPDKYVVRDPNNSWSCWPEEAIKAQVIAARSYGRFQGSLCSTAACQVYLGGNAKQWAADETKDLVIVSNSGTHANQIINAVYSSDNSQGGGTAHNETVWQNFTGVGTPHTYLRSVNDSAFARATSWTNWVYQSKAYTYEDVLSMLKSQTSNSNIRRANRIEKINIERDPSGRVSRMLLYLDTSSEPQSIGGWWFKNFWNIWQGENGKTDYIYSQTFYFNYE
jgi:peptidoglycan hydrolase-like amidase